MFKNSWNYWERSNILLLKLKESSWQHCHNELLKLSTWSNISFILLPNIPTRLDLNPQIQLKTKHPLHPLPPKTTNIPTRPSPKTRTHPYLLLHLTKNVPPLTLNIKNVKSLLAQTPQQHNIKNRIIITNDR